MRLNRFGLPDRRFGPSTRRGLPQVTIVRSMQDGVTGWRLTRKGGERPRVVTWVVDRVDADRLRDQLQTGCTLDEAYARMYAALVKGD